MPQRVKADEFLALVGERAADLDDPGTAQAAARAVLATLGDQLTGGALDGLARALPPEFANDLRRGGEQGSGMGADEFLSAVARREGVGDGATVAGHVQAVFHALGACADRDAIDSAREQLTAELRRLWLSEGEVPGPGESAGEPA